MDGTHRSAIARQESRLWASPDSFPLCRQSGGRGGNAFMQVIRTFPNSSKILIPNKNPFQRLSSRCSHD
jgi:hypothetical protein